MNGLSAFIILLFCSYCSAVITSAYDDAKCQEQGKKLKDVSAKSFIKEFQFVNETRTSLLLSWSPANKESIVLVTTQGSDGSSGVYISKNAGENFNPITEKFDGGKISVLKAIGLQRNPHQPSHILLISADGISKHVLWISKNEGDDWQKVTTSILFHENIKFYKKNPLWGLTTSTNGDLYVTQDGGFTWKSIQEHTEKFVWSTHEKDKDGSVYILRRTDSFGVFSRLLGKRHPRGIGVTKDLLKIDGYSTKPRVIFQNVWQFSAHGKFLYVSQRNPENALVRHMKVSIDGGTTFNEVQLPSITPDRFYAIMDMSEELIFMHVDNPGDTGHGTLYTSGSDGILFSQSLKHHLYPNFLSISDFYPVLSMRGTYITTQMNDDNSMHTVISFNRGAEWQALSKPINIKECPASLKSCNLQVSSLYSKVNHVKQIQTYLPLSSKYAPGIILVHGHSHISLQTTPPDVYVSSNGGHSWNKALTGPHHYQIADHGGLLIAVADNAPNVVKFSTDEGRCWHHYKFTETDFHLTGVLTEPNNKIMKVVIWGFGTTDHKWRVYPIDFSKIVPKACDLKTDYEDWVPHGEMQHRLGSQWNGCLLGVKEKFMRLKKDSWCSNGEAFEAKSEKTPCTCTKDDYECEYGFSRPVNSWDCAKDKNIPELDVCEKGNLEKIISTGYRRLPGNKCTGGFEPDRTKQLALNKRCGVNEKGIDYVKTLKDKNTKVLDTSKSQPVSHAKKTIDKSKIVWIVAAVCLGIIICVLVAVMFARYRQMRERDLSLKFSLLSDAHEGDFSATVDADLLDAGSPPEMANGGPKPVVQGKTNPVLRSYHDDSDVDILE